MYSGDEFYGDEITSGSSYHLTLEDRESLINDLVETGDYTRMYLITLTDAELSDIADQYLF